jgi:DNA-binding NarL/FixJ family response regulator
VPVYHLPVIRQWPLVGRSEELAVIADATRANTRRARGIVLTGAAGVGKTRVAREAVSGCAPRKARRHWIVATATARNVPLGAFADVASDFGPDPMRRVREVIDALLVDARPGEVVVGVDDAHLLDDLSAFTVHQLVTRRLATVIVTIRSGESPPDDITAIWRDHHLDRLELQPLSHPEIADLVEQVLGGPVDALSAQRLWQYTQGNTLYLRHLLDSEVDSGRMAHRSGVWLWDGQPRLSPTLAELLEARIAQVPDTVCEVLDALAVAEPLDTDILATVASSDALVEAETLGLITCDTSSHPAAARLAHPLLGELRRAGSLRLRRLRGRIASELGQRDVTDPRALLRRAVLTMESDLSPEPELLLAAAAAAMQLMDLPLAETLAKYAVEANGGIEAKLTHAMALAWQERTADAEAALADLARQTSGPVRAQVATLRAFNFAAIQGLAVSAERELDIVAPTDDNATQEMAAAVRALIELVRGHPAAAVDRATAVVAGTPVNDNAYVLATWALVTGLGELGRVDEIEPAASAGYRLAETSAEASHLRMPLAALQAISYRLAGALTSLDSVATYIRRDTIDVPFQQAWHSFLAGMSAMSRGDLAAAQRSLQETLALAGGGGTQLKGYAQSWLAAVTGMAGKAVDARRECATLNAQKWFAQEGACTWDAEKAFTEAWVCAAEGAVSQAISIVRDAAAKEAARDRLAWEVVLLQAATQFGDDTTAARLAELSVQVQGPRAPAAAAHAAALAAGDGDQLVDASRLYEEFGDRLAAADAAAHAVIAYQNAGLRGAAMTASATVERLASDCPGAQTPALRAVTAPPQFTARQREVISLAAQGLSNKDIADRLAMSTRSVEGHIFRASQRVGATNREQLIDMLHRQ